jgi:6-phosphogluconolactonase
MDEHGNRVTEMKVFTSRQCASSATTDLIIEQLSAQLQQQARASLMVSGGSTPAACFELLSESDLPWSRIDVTVTDERNVSPVHADSNENMVREKLMSANAGCANFVKLESSTVLSLFPFACTLVGMGEDGHFASLFPDSPQLEAGLCSAAPVVKVTTPSSPYDRTSASLGTLCASNLIILLAFGDAKRKLLDAPEGFPISHLLSQDKATVRTIWAP